MCFFGFSVCMLSTAFGVGARHDAPLLSWKQNFLSHTQAVGSITAVSFSTHRRHTERKFIKLFALPKGRSWCASSSMYERAEGELPDDEAPPHSWRTLPVCVPRGRMERRILIFIIWISSYMYTSCSLLELDAHTFSSLPYLNSPSELWAPLRNSIRERGMSDSSFCFENTRRSEGERKIFPLTALPPSSMCILCHWYVPLTCPWTFFLPIVQSKEFKFLSSLMFLREMLYA